MRKSLRVRLFSHHFEVTEFSRQVKDVLTNFALRYADYQLVRNPWSHECKRELKKIYAASTADRTEYRFHINTYKDFLLHMSNAGYPQDQMQIEEVPLYEPVKVELRDRGTKPPREEQLKIIAHLSSKRPTGTPHLGITRVAETQTGSGKTVMAEHALIEHQSRVGIIIRPQYIKRWLDDLVKDKDRLIDLEPKDVMVIQGSSDFRAMVAMAKANALESKVIIISNKTMQRFITHYEQFNRDTFDYGCSPVELCQILGLGVMLVDEVHQDFHFNFKLQLYTHCPVCLDLSATLESDNKTTARMYTVMFPPETRVDKGQYKKYIAVRALLYGLNKPEKVKWVQRGRSSYSQVAFEDSIMKNKDMIKNYLDNITDAVSEFYIKVREPGQKLLIFAAQIAMCELIRDHLRSLYPDLVINKYTGGDQYATLLSSDISVSTLGSAGTAVDIPGLRVVLSTTSVDSVQANYQALGRLREMKGPWKDVTPFFLYFVCIDVPPQMRYHERKQQKFRGRVVSHVEMVLDKNV